MTTKTKTKPPAKTAGAPTTIESGYVLQLVGVDPDQADGWLGCYLDIDDACSAGIAKARVFRSADAARSWITAYADGAIGEVWAVVDRATGQRVPDDKIVDEAPTLMSADEAASQGELLPPDAGAAPAVAADVTGLEIDGAGEARLVAVALRAHAEDLAKLAKNAKALGRLAEATTMERDARLIAEELLTQLEPQTQLPFGYVDVRAALTARIHGKLRARLANRIRQDMPVLAGEQTQDREEKILAKIDDFEAILGNVAEIVVSLVEPVVVEAAERGVTAGRLARETTAPALARETTAPALALEAAEAVERAA